MGFCCCCFSLAFYQVEFFCCCFSFVTELRKMAMLPIKVIGSLCLSELEHISLVPPGLSIYVKKSDVILIDLSFHLLEIYFLYSM